jgi:Tfp pilus assembly protein PilV
MTGRRQAGFSLIEALSALLITAFGMLTVAGFQTTLSRNSDVAKQRSEAVRLAQLKMEELRAYQQLASDGPGSRFDYTADVVSGADTVSPTTGSYTTNTSYARTWTVTGNGTDPQKWIRVSVSWTDRANETQAVSLQSAIARMEPKDIGTLAVGPGGTKPRTPKNRSLDIPYPAVSLANERSGFQPPSLSGTPSPFYIFDNVTGDVLGSCTTALQQDAAANFGDGNCSAFTVKPYLLTGYVRFVLGNFQVRDFVNPAGPAMDLAATVALDVGAGSACYTQKQKVVSAGNIAPPRNISGAERRSGIVTVTTSGNHGFSAGQFVSISSPANASFNGVFKLLSASSNQLTYAQSAGDGGIASGGSSLATVTQVQEITIPLSETAPPGYNAVVSTFVAYACVVTPADHDSNPSTPNRWWGKFQIAPVGGWLLGTTNQAYKLCRYTGDYVGNGQVSNSEHPLYYRGVTGVLDNQNYVVIEGHRSCPTDSAVDTSTGKYTNVNTTRHQTDADGGGGALSGTNPGGANGNGGFTSVEPTYSTTAALPML